MSKKYKAEEAVIKNRLQAILDSNFSVHTEMFGHFQLFLTDPNMDEGLLSQLIQSIENKQHKKYPKRIRTLAVQAWISFNCYGIDLPVRNFMEVSLKFLSESERNKLEDLLVSIVEGVDLVDYKIAMKNKDEERARKRTLHFTH